MKRFYFYVVLVLLIFGSLGAVLIPKASSEPLYQICYDNDGEDYYTASKVTIITREGFWPKKDELGRDRTPQSRAYAELAKGDFLWQIDIDEFYKADDMHKIISMLQKDPKFC